MTPVFMGAVLEVNIWQLYDAIMWSQVSINFCFTFTYNSSFHFLTMKHLKLHIFETLIFLSRKKWIFFVCTLWHM